MNRKGLILFFGGGFLLASFFLVQSLSTNAAGQHHPWDKAGQPIAGSPADKTRALRILSQAIEKLHSLQSEVAADPRLGIADSPQEKLTEGHLRLEEIVDGTYPELDKVLQSFEEVERRWLAQAKRSLADGDRAPSIAPVLPAFKESAYRLAAGDELAEEYRELYAALYKDSRDKRDAVYQKWEMRTLGDFEDLLTLHRLRSRYLATIVDQLGHDKLLELTPERWNIVAMEMRLIGHRYHSFLTVKKAAYSQKLLDGVAGWLNIVSQVGRLALAFFVPIALYLALRVLSRWLLSTRERPFGPTVRLFLQIMPELGALLVLAPAEQSLTNDLALMELAIIPGVFRYLIYYKVGTQLARAFGFYMARGLPQKVQSSVTAKIEKSVKVLVGSIVGIKLFLFCVYSAIGKALVYWLLDSVSVWVMVFAFVVVSWIWKPLLPELAFSTLGTPFRRGVKVVEASPFGWLLAPFVFVLILCLTLFFEIASFGRRFEWFNELLASLFRHRIGASTSAVQDVPEAYRELFRKAGSDQQSRSVQVAYRRMKPILEEFAATGRCSATIVLCGPRGTGRSVLIERLREEYGGEVEVAELEFGTRILTESELIVSVAAQLLDKKVQTVEELFALLQDLPAKLVLVRGGHNLFLSRVGGFEAIKVLTRVMSLGNLLFCFSFEPHSWRYLQGALPEVVSDPVVIDLQRLLPDEIRDFVLERHRSTGYELLYDNNLVGLGFDSSDSSSQENAFFQLLWDTSEGIPGIAAEVWLDSLELVEENVVRARIPHRVGLSELDLIRRDTLFLFAAIYRHETLSAEEASCVTDLPLGLTEQTFRMGVHKTFLVETPEGYRVSSSWYAPLARYLRRKNYLYGR